MWCVEVSSKSRYGKPSLSEVKAVEAANSARAAKVVERMKVINAMSVEEYEAKFYKNEERV